MLIETKISIDTAKLDFQQKNLIIEAHIKTKKGRFLPSIRISLFPDDSLFKELSEKLVKLIDVDAI